MIKRTFVFCSFFAGLCAPVSVALSACSSDDDDTVSPPATGDASTSDTGTTTTTTTTGDGSTSGATWVLATSGTTTSELVAVNTATGAVDGRLAFAGGFGTAYNGGSAPFLLESAKSVVGELQASAPWNLTSTWDVTSGSVTGQTYSNPQAVVVTAGTKAYVLLNTRNVIDVIDPSQTVDGGAPSNSIDLSSLLQTSGGDADGLVDVQAGFYDATRQRLWVVLEGIYRTPPGIPCTSTKATLIAIDTTTNALVNLGGTGPGGAYTFSLFDPYGVAYDSANDRVITANYGCLAAASADAGADAGPGPLQQNGLEVMALADGTSTTLLTGASVGRGGEVALLGGGQVFAVFSDPVTYASTGYQVDLTSKTTVNMLTTFPDSFVSDGNGTLYGTMAGPFADGGAGENVVKFNVADGGYTTLATAPFTDPSGYVGGVALWAKP